VIGRRCTSAQVNLLGGHVENAATAPNSLSIAIPRTVGALLPYRTLAGTDGTTPIASDHLQIVNVGVVIAPSLLVSCPCSSPTPVVRSSPGLGLVRLGSNAAPAEVRATKDLNESFAKVLIFLVVPLT
jgi:hypothetical protein